MRRELRQFAKVLRGCGQRKFIMGAEGATQSEAIQLQDVLQVGK